MKNQLIILFIFGIFAIAASGQGMTNQTPNIYVSATSRQRSPEEVAALRILYETQQRDAQIERLKIIQNRGLLNSADSVMSSLYNKKQLQFIDKLNNPNNLEQVQYKQLLGHSNTGFVTLLSENNCIEKFEDNCLSQTLLGKGAYFSFRLKNYIHSGWADIGYKQNWFFSLGYITQSLFVELGDVSVDDLTLQSKGIKFLTDFVPADNAESADQQRIALEKGIRNDDFIYSNAAKVVSNQTYALRSVAYQSKVVTTFDLGKNKIKIDLLNGDEREDVIVVFRVNGIDEKGNARIVWREMQSKKPPKLKLSKEKGEGK